jgi:hypothetical protein
MSLIGRELQKTARKERDTQQLADSDTNRLIINQEIESEKLAGLLYKQNGLG